MTHRTPNRSGLAPTLAGLLALAFPVAPSAAAAPAPLAFQVNEGKNLNAFFRHDARTGNVVERVQLPDDSPVIHGAKLWNGYMVNCDDVGWIFRFRMPG